MPFKIKTVMEEKLEFVRLAEAKTVSFSALCTRFGITRPTGYKWLRRYKDQGEEGLRELSRRPDKHPNACSPALVEAVLSVKKREPHWGAKKLLVVLRREGAINPEDLPSERTINRILKRYGLSTIQPKAPKATGRFEYEQPNQLWQMDFKGHFGLLDGGRCYPLTITDDHSRYNITLKACSNQKIDVVKPELIKAFKRYGLPDAILCDNSPPWGSTGLYDYPNRRVITQLQAWLIRLNVEMIHGSPRHPQTQGKCERFHRTLKHELLDYNRYKSLAECNRVFKAWRNKYNHYRPHEALEMNVPSDRYEVSTRAYPGRLPKIEYGASDLVLRVDRKGNIYFKGKRMYVGEGLQKQSVAVRNASLQDTYEVFYCNKVVAQLTLKV